MKKLVEKGIWTVEVADGDWTDYSDCYWTVFAFSEKEAWKKAKDIGRPIKRMYLRKTIRYYE